MCLQIIFKNRKKHCLLIMVNHRNLAAIYLILHRIKKTRRKRRWWIRPAFQRRIELSEHTQLLPHLRSNDPEMFFRYLRMNPDKFDYLVFLLSDSLNRYSFRESLSAQERLEITLTFLATGCSQQDLSFRFHRGRSTISSVLSETCKVIWEKLSPIYISVPDNGDKWLEISKGFWERWNFPNCIGSIDGKHFRIKCPNRSGSTFHNYKGYFSSLVLAMCDHDYNFIYVNVGNAGREGDSGSFRRSDLYQCLDSNSLSIPFAKKLTGTDHELPLFVVGDEAFPLKPFLMRPYPGRGTQVLPWKQQIYNYRLSRARRTIENCFGILVARWRIFHRPIEAKIENCEHFIKAAFVLHNFLRKEESKSNEPRYITPDFIDQDDNNGGIIPGGWRSVPSGNGVTNIGRLSANISTSTAMEIRETISDFLVSPSGAVSWQNNIVKL